MESDLYISELRTIEAAPAGYPLSAGGRAEFSAEAVTPFALASGKAPARRSGLQSALLAQLSRHTFDLHLSAAQGVSACMDRAGASHKVIGASQSRPE